MRNNMGNIIFLTIILSGFWLLLSGHYTPFVLSCGIFSVLLTVYIAHRMSVVDDETQVMLLPTSILLYMVWLIKEIVLSNIAVCRCIWTPKLDISPTMFTVKASQKTPFGIMLYANSITVTPGTVCVDVRGDELDVHALTLAAAQGVQSGEMDRRISQLEI